MSYSKTYTHSVRYSGTAYYSHSYPASEHGGTIEGSVDYDGTVPVTVDLYVDTAPFDGSVQNCNDSVRNLNGAVVTMNSAQVASIYKAGDEVSSHITAGFFNMIKSELDQNIAALYAKFQSVFNLITKHSEAVEKQHVVMQDDYSRISDRYTQIFNNLDEELEKRVVALDRNVFDISKKVQSEQLYSETSKKVSQFLLGVNEDDVLQQQLLIAKAKSRVISAIEGLSRNIVQESAYARMVNGIVADRNCSESENNYIPVIFTESSNFNSDIVDYTCYSNPPSAVSKNEIGKTVKNYFVSNPGEGRNWNEKEKKQVDEAFALIAEKEFQDLQDEKSLRVYETLKKLKEA